MELYQALDQFRNILKIKLDLYINTAIPYVLLLCTAISFVFVGYKIMLVMTDPDEKIGKDTLIRPILTLMAITLYIPLVQLLLFDTTDIVSAIIKHAAQGVTGKSGNAFETSFQTSITHVQGTGADGNGVYDVIQINPFIEIIHIIIYFIASIVGGYMLFRQLIMIYIYYIVGLFVLPFSLIVSNQKALQSWFLGFLSILMWEPILNIIKTIIILLPVSTTDFSNVLLSIALQIVMIFMILKVPQFSNILIDSEMSSKVGGRTGNFLRSVPGKVAGLLKK